ncbi:MAG: hypothetical protein M3R50_11430, partial [Bacteroidota bacterium]|nr:hypothetical protein [Bacteroidota bacterium]
MIQKKLLPVFINILLLLFFAFNAFAQKNPNPSSLIIPLSKIAYGFATPPDSLQLSVYWYWISDNISKEGVIKDLHAMKKVGINRAFIGNIGLDETPYGKVKILSDAWW